MSKIDEIEARVRPTICSTYGRHGMTTEGRILEADFHELMQAARDGEFLSEGIARLQRGLERLKADKNWRPA